MKQFRLVRDVDESGVSGTGIVAEGVEFSDGTCVIRWTVRWRSTAVYANLTELMAIHGHGGKTRLWLDSVALPDPEEGSA